MTDTRPAAAAADLGIGLLGCGTVGSAVVRLLQTNGEDIRRRTGIGLRLARVAAAHPAKPREVRLEAGMLTPDAAAVVADDRVDVVVEVMGGIEPARTLLLDAIRRGKSIVTANKQLLAQHGPDLFAEAKRAGVDLRLEASVGGGLPVIQPLRESLAANRIQEVVGILNGTTNYILTKMAEERWEFARALAEAQRRGFAEADPAADVEGHDAAAKLAILATITFGTPVRAGDVYREGIGRISAQDIQFAEELGYVVKLLAITRESDGRVEARVHPAFLARAHPLAAIGNELNAVFVRGDAVGEVMFVGRGAGGAPTASAVVADLIDIAWNRRAGAHGRVGFGAMSARALRPMEETASPFYLLMQVADRPGVFARIAAIFGEENVSIASVVQKSRGETADIVMVTHTTNEKQMRRVLSRLEGLDVVRAVRNVIRVVDGDA
ncbi:MAG: homoserine dehydrogenase [Bacillati bacterium ANGP1]|uniref:Homoserine dehydrogenase n=1 Tax=Candidatus Segetimicrobium genomatis TaxID=2569760 RepID=A0A537K411_9BACT|nr:MAG: homoserine dehydrogenase [Terrabacteria group bacterium ANGP1]